MSVISAPLPAHWNQLLRSLAAEAGSLASRRLMGAQQVRLFGFPEPQEEAWRFTSLRGLERLTLEFDPTPDNSNVLATDLQRVSLGAALTPRLGFIDGVFAPQFSSLDALPEGLTLTPMAGAGVIPELGTIATNRRHRAAAFADAFATDGALIRIAANAQITQPVHLVFWTRRHNAHTVTAPRVLVVAEPGSSVELVMETVGDSEAVYCTAESVELLIRENASVRFSAIQRESELAYHLGVFAARLERYARLETHHVALGGRLARTDVDVVLAGDGASCDLSGVYLTGGKQHTDFHTYVDHASPHTVSVEKFKGVLDGKSTAVFNGRILVREGAQKIDSTLYNNNLLLSKQATVNTNPELEIFADDVKAAHGATVGQIEDEQLFYLRARGIGEDEARRILIRGFAGEIIQRLRVESLRDRLMDVIDQRFS